MTKLSRVDRKNRLILLILALTRTRSHKIELVKGTDLSSDCVMLMLKRQRLDLKFARVADDAVRSLGQVGAPTEGQKGGLSRTSEDATPRPLASCLVLGPFEKGAQKKRSLPSGAMYVSLSTVWAGDTQNVW